MISHRYPAQACGLCNLAALAARCRALPSARVLGTGLPVWCAGAAIFLNDLIVVDNDGGVVIPAALIDDILELALEQERLEGWIMYEVNKGAALPSLYPTNAENKARCEESKKQSDKRR